MLTLLYAALLPFLLILLLLLPLIVPSFLFLNIVLDAEIRGGAANWLEPRRRRRRRRIRTRALANSSSRLVVPVSQPIDRFSRFFVDVDKAAFLVYSGKFINGGSFFARFSNVSRVERRGKERKGKERFDGTRKFFFFLPPPPSLPLVINVVMRNAHVGVY